MKNENVSLAFNDIDRGGSSDKVYHLSLEKQGAGFIVTARYGRRGSALATDSKTKNGPLPYVEAKQIFDRVLREKIGKGYQTLPCLAAAHEPEVPETCPDRPPSRDLKPKAQELLEEITSEAVLRYHVTSDDYWMQDKTDGHSRGVVKTSEGWIYGLNKRGGRVELPSALLAELMQVPLVTFQIDAELVGEQLVCRDLLVADRDISKLPYEERFLALVAALNDPGFKRLSVVATWQGARNKGAALMQQQKERREGVVFKLKHAPHRPGRNSTHKKFKFVKTLSVIAGKPRAKGKDSVEIYLIDDKGAGKHPANYCRQIRVGTVSLIGKPQIKEGDVLEVRYLYAFPSKMLCQARFDRIRTDVSPKECTTAQLIFKRAVDA